MFNFRMRETVLAVLTLISLAGWWFDRRGLENRLVSVRAGVSLIPEQREVSSLQKMLDEAKLTGSLHGMPPMPGFSQSPRGVAKAGRHKK